jgi:hypothetical protein
MKPRIFVSSTYFDLKHVRERLERFIENYYFEPVLFESDNVIFEHNKPLDLSCYNEVKLCHIMILIIGGRYGSLISGENINEKKKSYDQEYISITRKEFDTAQKMNIPVFIFIEKNVYAEYHTYTKNKDFFDEKTDTDLTNKFSFAHVDDINVFKFINMIKGMAIKTFEKIEDIENYLGNQIAGMLYLYLEQLQNKKQDEQLLDSVSELKNISQRMNEMLVAVGKNVIKENAFEDVIFSQNKLLVEFFVDQFLNSLKFKNEISDISREMATDILSAAKETILDEKNVQSLIKEADWEKQYALKQKIEMKFREKLISIDQRLVLEHFNYYKIYESFTKIFEIVSKDKNLKTHLESSLVTELQFQISGLPF